jgi:hypothetical protein
MKCGTIIKIDGRIATVVSYWPFDFGIIWGEHKVDENNLPEPDLEFGHNTKIEIVSDPL